MSKNLMERILIMSEEGSDALHEAMTSAVKSIIQYFDSAEAGKENLMKTDMKVANTVLTSFAHIRQAEGGKLQAFTVMGERLSKLAEFREFIEENLPEIKVGGDIKKLKK